MPRTIHWAVLTPALAGCATGPAPSLPPAPSVELEAAADSTPAEWLDALLPSRAVRYDVQWRLETRSGATSGRAVAMVIPPDSLHFEYRAPFGRRGSALVVGAEVTAAEPADEVQRLIAVVPLFWAALGIPWRPGDEIPTRVARPGPTAWQVQWGDTVLTYVQRTVSPLALTAHMVAARRPVGSAYVAFAEAPRHPRESRVQFADARAMLALRFERVDTTAVGLPAVREVP